MRRKTESEIKIELAEEELAQSRLRTRLLEQQLAVGWSKHHEPKDYIRTSYLQVPMLGPATDWTRHGVVIRKAIPSSNSPGIAYFDLFLSKREVRDVIKEALGKGWVTSDDPLGSKQSEPLEGLPDVEWDDEG